MSTTQAFLLGATIALFAVAILWRKISGYKGPPLESVLQQKTQTEISVEYSDIGERNTDAILANTAALIEQTALLRQLLEKQNRSEA